MVQRGGEVPELETGSWVTGCRLNAKVNILIDSESALICFANVSSGSERIGRLLIQFNSIKRYREASRVRSVTTRRRACVYSLICESESFPMHNNGERRQHALHKIGGKVSKCFLSDHFGAKITRNYNVQMTEYFDSIAKTPNKL